MNECYSVPLRFSLQEQSQSCWDCQRLTAHSYMAPWELSLDTENCFKGYCKVKLSQELQVANEWLKWRCKTGTFTLIRGSQLQSFPWEWLRFCYSWMWLTPEFAQSWLPWDLAGVSSKTPLQWPVGAGHLLSLGLLSQGTQPKGNFHTRILTL